MKLLPLVKKNTVIRSWDERTLSVKVKFLYVPGNFCYKSHHQDLWRQVHIPYVNKQSHGNMMLGRNTIMYFISFNEKRYDMVVLVSDVYIWCICECIYVVFGAVCRSYKVKFEKKMSSSKHFFTHNDAWLSSHIRHLLYVSLYYLTLNKIISIHMYTNNMWKLCPRYMVQSQTNLPYDRHVISWVPCYVTVVHAWINDGTGLINIMFCETSNC